MAEIFFFVVSFVVDVKHFVFMRELYPLWDSFETIWLGKSNIFWILYRLHFCCGSY